MFPNITATEFKNRESMKPVPPIGGTNASKRKNLHKRAFEVEISDQFFALDEKQQRVVTAVNTFWQNRQKGASLDHAIRKATIELQYAPGLLDQLYLHRNPPDAFADELRAMETQVTGVSING